MTFCPKLVLQKDFLTLLNTLSIPNLNYQISQKLYLQSGEFYAEIYKYNIQLKYVESFYMSQLDLCFKGTHREKAT